MPEKADSVVRSEGTVRVLALGAIRVHNDHVLEGKRQVARCRVCSSGLGGAVAEIEAARKDVVVAKGDGTDRSGDAPSPRGDGEDRKRDEDKVPW